MGLILDSTVVIAAKRSGENVEEFLARIANVVSDQEVALTSVGSTELMLRLYRAKEAHIRTRREAFLQDLLDDLPVHAYTKETALLAGRIHG